MDYNQFKGIALKVIGREFEYNYNDNYKKNMKREILEELSVRWVSGGQKGGSCWGSEGLHDIEAEEEPEFEELDKVLEKVCPQISFLQYKRICSECIEKDSDCDNEYYGNWTKYSIKKVNLPKLFQTLKEKNFL
jgi:hypothetical protein